MVKLVHDIHFLDEVFECPGHAQYVVLKYLDSDGNLTARGGRPIALAHYAERTVPQLTVEKQVLLVDETRESRVTRQVARNTLPHSATRGRLVLF